MWVDLGQYSQWSPCCKEVVWDGLLRVMCRNLGHFVGIR